MKALFVALLVGALAGGTATIAANGGLSVTAADPQVLSMTGQVAGPWTLAAPGATAMTVSNGTVELAGAAGLVLDVFSVQQAATTNTNEVAVSCGANATVLTGGCDCQAALRIASSPLAAGDGWTCFCNNATSGAPCGASCITAYATCLRQ